MRWLLALLAIALLGLGASACSGTSKTTPAAANQPAKPDRDNDGDNNNDDAKVLNYGHAAGPTELRELTALVRHYYAVAAASDGAGACAMLYPLTAESIVEENGNTQGLRGRTCAVVMSKLFELHHQTLVSDDASVKFYLVRVRGNRALTLLTFAGPPEVRQLPERRVGATWKVFAPLDGIIE
jgi:hypothetical protein